MRNPSPKLELKCLLRNQAHTRHCSRQYIICSFNHRISIKSCLLILKTEKLKLKVEYRNLNNSNSRKEIWSRVFWICVPCSTWSSVLLMRYPKRKSHVCYETRQCRNIQNTNALKWQKAEPSILLLEQETAGTKWITVNKSQK